MITANITFVAEQGKLKLEGCNNNPVLNELEKTFENFDDLLIGKPIQVIIDIIK